MLTRTDLDDVKEPVGALLIELPQRELGGAIPDAWPLALAAMVGLDEILPRMAAFRDHAVAIAEALVADGVVDVLPNLPHTPMFHVLLPVPPAAAEVAGTVLIEEKGLRLFSRVGAEPWPDRCRVELTVGEHTMDFTPDEVAALFATSCDVPRERHITVAGCPCSPSKASRRSFTRTRGSRRPPRSSAT